MGEGWLFHTVQEAQGATSPLPPPCQRCLGCGESPQVAAVLATKRESVLFETLRPQGWLLSDFCVARRCEIRLYWYLHIYDDVLQPHEDSGHLLVLAVQTPTSQHSLPFLGNVARSWSFGPLWMPAEGSLSDPTRIPSTSNAQALPMAPERGGLAVQLATWTSYSMTSEWGPRFQVFWTQLLCKPTPSQSLSQCPGATSTGPGRRQSACRCCGPCTRRRLAVLAPQPS